MSASTATPARSEHALIDAAKAIHDSRAAAVAYWDARARLEAALSDIADAIAQQVGPYTWDEILDRPVIDVGPYLHWLPLGAEAKGLEEDASNFHSREGLIGAIDRLEERFRREFEDAGPTAAFRDEQEAALCGELGGDEADDDE